VTGALATATSYGQGLAATGDLDGDGLPDLAIGSHTGPLTSSPTTGRTGFVLVTHLPDPTPETGTPPAVDPLVDWGIRANLRSYVYGAATTQDAPPIQATAGVTCYANPDAAVGGCDPRPMTGADYPSAFRWTPVGADLDVAEGEGTVATRGTVTLTYLAHCFTMRFSNPWWTIADGTATLAADVAVDGVEGCSPAGIPGGASPGDSQERITLGTFPLLGTATTTATTITWHTQPGALSADGSAALGVLAPGAVLDPATITVPLGIGALPEPETESPPVVITVPGPATTVTVPVPSEAPSGSADAPASSAAPAATPAPAAAPPRNTAPIRLTAKRTGKASKAGTRKVTITLPQAIGSDPEQFYGVWLTRSGTRVAVGRLRGTKLELTVSAVRRRVAGRVRTTYPPITGRYTLRPAAAGTAVPTITLTVR
jgi:hypothetical protein